MRRLLLLTSLCLVALLMFTSVAVAATASATASATAAATAQYAQYATASPLPATGGIGSSSVIALAAGILLVASGLVARRVFQ